LYVDGIDGSDLGFRLEFMADLVGPHTSSDVKADAVA
jgi:hypothetical protein